ncbi:MAG: AraC family transcriptional regulator ligand-binding domain-containing protein [Pseudomonadales bacterium]
MSEFLVPVSKFQRLLDYIEQIGLDSEALASRSGLKRSKLASLSDDTGIPGVYYSNLYEATVKQMQQLDRAIPWAAGIGSDAFRLMCYSIITCKTLGEALLRAQQFDDLVHPVTGHRIQIGSNDATAQLSYEIEADEPNDLFAPPQWDRTVYYAAVAKSSGLRVWFSFCGWLIGRVIELEEVTVAAPSVTPEYQASLEELFSCPVRFDAEHNALRFPAKFLSYRLVHNSNSLDQFLQHVLYQLLDADEKPASTSDAIQSLLGTDFSEGIPPFEAMAESLHMSTSSLRRRLMKENTSYQQIKDERRHAAAIDYLRRNDMKIQDVGELLGFTETSSFVRSFRNWTGMTPKVFRDSAQSIVEH